MATDDDTEVPPQNDLSRRASSWAWSSLSAPAPGPARAAHADRGHRCRRQPRREPDGEDIRLLPLGRSHEQMI
jgi:hypothetical protein